MTRQDPHFSLLPGILRDENRFPSRENLRSLLLKHAQGISPSHLAIPIHQKKKAVHHAQMVLQNPLNGFPPKYPAHATGHGKSLYLGVRTPHLRK
jgi:hypothetical protein